MLEEHKKKLLTIRLGFTRYWSKQRHKVKRVFNKYTVFIDFRPKLLDVRMHVLSLLFFFFDK